MVEKFTAETNAGPKLGSYGNFRNGWICRAGVTGRIDDRAGRAVRSDRIDRAPSSLVPFPYAQMLPSVNDQGFACRPSSS